MQENVFIIYNFGNNVKYNITNLCYPTQHVYHFQQMFFREKWWK